MYLRSIGEQTRVASSLSLTFTVSAASRTTKSSSSAAPASSILVIRRLITAAPAKAGVWLPLSAFSSSFMIFALSMYSTAEKVLRNELRCGAGRIGMLQAGSRIPHPEAQVLVSQHVAEQRAEFGQILSRQGRPLPG